MTLYDASSRKDIRRAQKASERLAEERRQFLRAAMDTVSGRRWLYHLLDECHLFADPFSGDALREAYLKGERNVGLRIFAEISTYCPDQYITMLKEENVRRSSLDTAAERSRGTDPGRDPEGRGDDDLTGEPGQPDLWDSGIDP